MRSLRRPVLLCLFIMVMIPARADAWFEWLDRLSGPGGWYGVKLDVRALCFGKPMPLERTDARLRSLADRLKKLNRSERSSVQPLETELLEIVRELEAMDAGLGVLRDMNLEQAVRSAFQPLKGRTGVVTEEEVKEVSDIQARVIRASSDLRTARAAITSGGIFVSLCSERRRTFALELGFTGLGTGGDEQFARNEPIYMTTATVGLSYRLPLPATRDAVDLGTNVGSYRFYSQGFDDFSGLIIEPYVDFHLPTAYTLSESKTERVLSRFTIRTGLVFFPGGFNSAQFASASGKDDISGREASPSVTVFFRLKG
jgi:hypothetical protein